MHMTVEKIRFLAEKNIKGIPKIIYIKGDNIEGIIKKYVDICSLLNIEGKILELKDNEAYLSYDREMVSSLIIYGIIDDEEEVYERAKILLEDDWSYEIIKELDSINIPSINIDINNLKIGYGKNSIILSKSETCSVEISEVISNLKDNGIIPIIAVTGTNGKTTTTRLIHSTLLSLGYKSGASTTGGIYIGNKVVKTGDTTGYYSALEVLKNKNIDIAVLETARGGIIKKGLGFKNAKVGIITSLSEDHMGMEGINTIEDLGKIKSLIKEGLDDDGIMIVRATKDIVRLFSKKDRLILFDNDPNELIKAHTENGGEAFYTRGKFIVHNKFGKEIKLVNLKELEFTHNGLSKSNTRNVMTAIAAINKIHNNIYEVIDAIKGLKCDLSTNRGRQNVINIKDFKLIIDYGHNSESFHEVFNMAKSLNPTLITGIITAAGDRSNEHIVELGEITASYCHKVIIKEQEDRRGREEKETAKLLYKGLKNKGFNDDKITILLEEEEAILKALNEAKSGEVIVSFSQFLNVTIPAINKYLRENGLEVIN
ncbi:Mur ligase family protein [Clostridium sardiniense]|uniref:Mur ligase family protein n=1 Tax=Clostridium sardiniense TaxID=29369 RepID=UPI00195C21C0|nr:Mur ligase family protein [Clostridium sardiniense]MBM7834419.1 cyanophycin synthetase [Clostridium sardiniense]